MKKKGNIRKIVIVFNLSIVIVICTIVFLLREEIFPSSNEINNVSINNADNNVNTSPLELKDYKIIKGDKYSINSFIRSYSKNYSLSFETEQMGNFTEPGNYEIRIVGISDNGEKIIKSAVLRILDKENNDKENNSTKDDTNNDQNSAENISNNENKNLLNESTKNNLNNSINENKNTNTKNNVTTTTTTKSSTPIKIDNITETIENISYKYGVTIKKNSYFNYDIYSDGNKILVDSYDDYSYDYSTFNATTNELKNEALALSNQNSAAINDVLGYVNQYRNEVGISPLTLDNSLNIAASIRALEMGWSRKFDHTRPNGTMCFSVIDELGIGYYTVGENIAYGYWDAASVSEGWKNSPGHYANMISSDYNKIGIGMANVNGNYYWVQLFTN